MSDSITRCVNEAIERLKALQDNDDIEAAHSYADEILCDLLTDLGYQCVVSEWEKVPKWYA